MSKWKVAGGAAIVLSIAGVLAWLFHRASPVQYVTVPLSRNTIERRVIATGTVNPVLTIIIGSYVSGVISDMSCDYNTRVHKGQLCARIDPRPYQAALDQAQGQLARDSAQLEGARVDLERYRTSLESNAIPRQTYEDELALVHQLEGSVQLDRGAVETARVNLEYTHIISPVDGTVVARNITIGQTVAASFQTPTLFLIATDLTKMQVDTNVSESDIGIVKEGQAARFTVEAFADRAFEGSVVQVRQAPQTVQNVVTYDVVVGVENPQFLLKPGMTATVGIVTERRVDVLRVPDQALRFTPTEAARAGVVAPGTGALSASGASAQVWVLREGAPVAVAIRTGLDDDTNSEVVSGDLKVGEPVIVGERRAARGARSSVFHFGF